MPDIFPRITARAHTHTEMIIHALPHWVIPASRQPVDPVLITVNDRATEYKKAQIVIAGFSPRSTLPCGLLRESPRY